MTRDNTTESANPATLLNRNLSATGSTMTVIQKTVIIEKLMQVAQLLTQSRTHPYTSEEITENRERLNKAIEISRDMSSEYFQAMFDFYVDNPRDSNVGLNDEARILRTIMLDRAHDDDQILQTKPDFEMLIYSTMIMGNLPPESEFDESRQQEYMRRLGKAINLSRKAIEAQFPPILDNLLLLSGSERDLDNPPFRLLHSVDQIPERLFYSAGYNGVDIPEGHIIAGYNGGNQEIIRGIVGPEQTVTWTYGLAAKRYLIADEILNQILSNNDKYTVHDKTAWTVNADGMSRYLDLSINGVSQEETYIVVNFAPRTHIILSGEFNDQNIFSADYGYDKPNVDVDGLPQL